jgi:hypothetical protein
MIFDFWPLEPAPAHSQMSLRDGLNVRLRGGIGCWIVGRCESMSVRRGEELE